MELAALALLAIGAIGILLLVSYPVNGHGSGYYPYFGPDGDRGPQPGSNDTSPPGVTRERR